MGSPTKTVSYRYDSRGNRSALIDHDGGRTSYTYDVMNRLTAIINPQGERTTYSYDAAGRRTVKKLANGTRASFTYDAAGNLTKLYNLKSTGAVVNNFDYTYDKVGNRMAVMEAGGNRVTWSYDNGYQLIGEHRTGANAYRDTFTYDPAGNRLLKNHDGARTTYAYDVANQLTYSQDAGGRTTFTFDADGNQQVVREPSGDRTTYAWDYENRMTLARLPAGIRNTMAYDADGLRVKLEESTGTKKFVWDDQNYLGETDAANDTQVVYTNEPQLYGNLVSQRRGGTSHWYHFDALGSTRELTDVSAVVTDTRLYDAWGNAVATTGSTTSPLRWVGEVGYFSDPQTGLHYVRARIYRPSIARWLSIDPLAFAGSEDTLYSYVSNNGIVFIDPSGAKRYTLTQVLDCEVAVNCAVECPRNTSDCIFTLQVQHSRTTTSTGRSAERVTFSFTNSHSDGCKSDINRAPDSHIDVRGPNFLPHCILKNDMFDEQGRYIPGSMSPPCEVALTNRIGETITFELPAFHHIEWKIDLELACTCNRDPDYPVDYSRRLTNDGTWRRDDL